MFIKKSAGFPLAENKCWSLFTSYVNDRKLFLAFMWNTLLMSNLHRVYKTIQYHCFSDQDCTCTYNKVYVRVYNMSAYCMSETHKSRGGNPGKFSWRHTTRGSGLSLSSHNTSTPTPKYIHIPPEAMQFNCLYFYTLLRPYTMHAIYSNIFFFFMYWTYLFTDIPRLKG
jgi:hypothetical protein